MLFAVHLPRFAANESFVNFDFLALATQFDEGTVLHRKANAVKHEPCRLLSDAKSASHFVGADAVLAVGDHPHRNKPLVQRQRRILKDCPDLSGELPLGMLALALPDAPCGDEAYFSASACGAFDTVRPAARNHEVNAVVRTGEVNDGLL